MGWTAHCLRAHGLVRCLPPLGVAVSIILCSPNSGAAPQNSSQPEVQIHQTAPAFRLHAERNLVSVRVVVRDAKGRAIGNLHKEDFRLLDDRTPQEISGFAVETASPGAAANQTPSSQAGETKGAASVVTPAAPQRFVGLYFDDFHLDAQGIGRTRNAAWGYVLTEVRPQDRVAIFTATGKDQLDFTSDREKLHEALLRVTPRTRSSKAINACLDIGEYQAYLIDQQHDPVATGIADEDANYCDCIKPGMSTTKTDRNSVDCSEAAKWRVVAEAAQDWSEAEMQSQYSLAGIEISVRRLAAMPGQRTLVLVSPGFLAETLHEKIDAIINWSLHQDVVISAVDAAGLYAYDNPHWAQEIPDSPQKTMLKHTELTVFRDVLATLTDRTGGTFFHNSNDFDDGFRQTAALPESYYVLSFSPTNFKPDGKFHSLKVSLNTRGPFTVEARRGYYATETAVASRAASEIELERVVFSQEEVHGLPADVTTRVDKFNDRESKLTVIIHVDLKSLPFHKEADRSVKTLVFDTALFDRDGKLVMGKEASLDLRLTDATLEKLTQSGLNAEANFQVAPGTYRVREVVRDSESKSLAALNCDAQVPAP